MQLLSSSQRQLASGVVSVLDDDAVFVLELRCAWTGPMVKTLGNFKRIWDNTGPSSSSNVLSTRARARSVWRVSETMDFRGNTALSSVCRHKLGRSRERSKFSMPGMLVIMRSMSSSPSMSLDSTTQLVL